MKNVFVLTTLLLLVFGACKKNDTQSKRFKGKAVSFQHGTAYMWYEMDEANNPARLAIAIDDAAMASLDNGSSSTHNNAASLPIPNEARSTIFTHGVLNWNPMGHPIQGIYDVPHFDLHFFTIPEEERLALPTYAQAPEKWNNYPLAEYMPLNYIPVTPGIPHMHGHWVDKTAPEFNGSIFTQSYIYGAHDGKLIYQEPMVLESFLRENDGFSRSIPQPAKVQKAGWYPTRMRIEKASGATSVILENFINRDLN